MTKRTFRSARTWVKQPNPVPNTTTPGDAALIGASYVDAGFVVQQALALREPRLNCPACGYENRETAKFCGECAERLPTSLARLVRGLT